MTGHQHTVMIIDYATLYPKTILLCTSNALTIVAELMKVFTRVGIPTEIVTDQGTNFISWLMMNVCELLKIKSLRTFIYRPQTDGLVKCFS